MSELFELAVASQQNNCRVVGRILHAKAISSNYVARQAHECPFSQFQSIPAMSSDCTPASSLSLLFEPNFYRYALNARGAVAFLPLPLHFHAHEIHLKDAHKFGHKSL